MAKLTKEQMIDALRDLAIRALDSDPRPLDDKPGYRHNVTIGGDLALRAIEQNSAAQVNAADSATHGLPGMSGLPAPADLVARLREAGKQREHYWLRTHVAIEDCHAAADLIERLVREKEAAERDAGRYRWLRENPEFLGWEWDFAAEGVDKEVDEAMKK